MEFKDYLKKEITTDDLMTVWKELFLPNTNDKILYDDDIINYIKDYGTAYVFNELMDKNSLEDYIDEYGDIKNIYYEKRGKIKLVSKEELENIMYKDEDKLIDYIVKQYDKIDNLLDYDYKSMYDRDNLLNRIA